MMKKYTYLMLFAFFLNSCDDGDLTVETFNFDEIKATSCQNSLTNELIYKIKGQESLLLKIPSALLKNESTAEGEPELLTIDDKSIRLVYRAYDGAVTTANICDDIKPITPNVTNEWFALGGTLSIITKPSYTINEEENSSRINGYTHNISITNITFAKPQTQIGPSFVFGDYTTTLKDTETLNLVFDESALQCGTSKLIYNSNGFESLTIENPETDLIVNTPTLPGSPRIKNISATNNKVAFKVYNNRLPDDYFCITPTPATPLIRETWTAESGTIEVETTTLGGNFKHIISFKNVKLVKGNVSFFLGNKFKSWELITTP